MKLNELTEKLQTLCHEGYSNCEVVLGVLDGKYKIDNVYKVEIGKDDSDTRVIFTIQSV